MIKNFKWLLLVSLTFAACSSENALIDANSTDGSPLTAGSADFSKYVALGDSFAAGFSDNALFIEGQKGAYPNLLAKQFALVGGGEFSTPLMADNVGGFQGSTEYTPRLYFNGTAPASVASPPFNQVSTTTLDPLGGSFNNMGIPGAKSFHLLTPGYGSSVGNPYFLRFASNATTTVIADAIAQDPSFFSLWIGGNDVLGYATTGGDGSNPITPTAIFDEAYSALISQLVIGEKKGVVANLPYVNSLPFFTAIPTNSIPGVSPTQATDLNQLFGGINSALAANSLPSRFSTIVADDGNSSTVEANPLLIVDESLLDISAQITAVLTPLYGPQGAAFIGGLYGKARHSRNTVDDRDFILLTTRSLITPPNNIQPELPPGLETFNVRGVTYPLQDSAVLTAAEALEIKIATDSYNTTIQAAATANGLAFVDAKAIMNSLTTTGISGNGFSMSSTFVTGGAFSLDGVHPSPRGYALIANIFLEAINTKYGSNIKGLDYGDYRILFPPVLN